MKLQILAALCTVGLCSLAGADEGQAAAAAAEEALWKGRYKVYLSGDSAWHQNAIELEGVTVEELTGTLEVDLSLGPEAREPNPDQVLHKVKFIARRAAEHTPYLAEILVGTVQPKVYRFELFPIESGKSWSGICSVGNRRAGVLVRRD